MDCTTSMLPWQRAKAKSRRFEVYRANAATTVQDSRERRLPSLSISSTSTFGSDVANLAPRTPSPVPASNLRRSWTTTSSQGYRGNHEQFHDDFANTEAPHAAMHDDKVAVSTSNRALAGSVSVRNASSASRSALLEPRTGNGTATHDRKNETLPRPKRALVSSPTTIPVDCGLCAPSRERIDGTKPLTVARPLTNAHVRWHLAIQAADLGYGKSIQLKPKPSRFRRFLSFTDLGRTRGIRSPDVELERDPSTSSPKLLTMTPSPAAHNQCYDTSHEQLRRHNTALRDALSEAQTSKSHYASLQQENAVLTEELARMKRKVDALGLQTEALAPKAHYASLERENAVLTEELAKAQRKADGLKRKMARFKGKIADGVMHEVMGMEGNEIDGAEHGKGKRDRKKEKKVRGEVERVLDGKFGMGSEVSEAF